MPRRELVKVHDATGRLAVEWKLPTSAAQDIVRGVLLGAKCFVRGRRPGETGLRDISEEISREFGSTFPPAFLSSREFVDVEIDWNGLLEHGRLLVPSIYEHTVAAAAAEATTTPRAAPRMTKREEVKTYIKENYPDGIPTGVPYKMIADDVGCDERTVRRALGRK
jgi:hypothetical protein